MSKKISEPMREKIERLKKLEIQLGHIPQGDWAIKQLNDEAFPVSRADKDALTETLFREICEILEDEDFTPEETAEAINQILQYENGPRYCSAEEVEESLENA